MADKEQSAKRRGRKKVAVDSEVGKHPKRPIAHGDEIEEPPMIIKGSSQGPIDNPADVPEVEWGLLSINPLDFNFDTTPDAAMPNTYKPSGSQRICGFEVFNSLNEKIFEFPKGIYEGRYQIIVTPYGAFFLLIINGNSVDCEWVMRSTNPLDYDFALNTTLLRPNSYILPGSQQSSGFLVLDSQGNPIFEFPKGSNQGSYEIRFR